MDDVSALIHLELFLLLFIITILVSSSNGGTSTTLATISHAKASRLVMKLVHRDSIFSPYYNPNDTISERVRRDMKRSTARFAYLKSGTNYSSSTIDDVRGGVIPDYHATSFLVNISIGQPPVPQLLVVDTGSYLLWIQCLPCNKCFKQICPVFDPSKSFTYRNLQCDSPYCSPGCDSESICPYYTKYGDDSYSSGTLGMEELRFLTSDEGTVSVPDSVFGCGHENVGFIAQESGILGLAANKYSLVSRMGSRFSYCIGNIDDLHYEYNQLIIGDGAKLEGYSTPMEVFDSKYYLTLEGISVGQNSLNINPETFRRQPRGNGGVIIDSGTTVTHLDRSVFNLLRAEVKSLIGGQFPEVNYRRDLLCYKGMASRDLKGFPVVTFHFAGGSDLVLDVDSMFMQLRGGAFCMAVVPADFWTFTIIGIRAQQHYNVAYDLQAMKIYFQRIDCELLED